jgi:F-type H+-transporting ATPase subunit b
MQAIIDLLVNFGVSWERLLGQIVTFVILLVVLRLVMYKPILRMLDERKQKIAQGLKDAEAAADERRRAEEKASAELKEATRKAEALLDEAKSAAESMRQDLMTQAQADLQRARDAQRAELERARQDMIDDVRKDVVQLVVATTSKVLQQELSKEQQQTLIRQAAKELE